MAEASLQKGKNKDFVHYLNILITFVFMFGFRFLPAPEPITPYGMAIIGVFIGVIWGWSTSSVGLVWTSMLGIVAVGFTDYGNVSASVSKIFASDTVMLLILGMFLMGPIQKSDLGEWIVTKFMTMKFLKGKPWRFTAMIIFCTGIMGFLANGFVVSLFMLTILGKLFEEAGYQKGDKYPVMLIIGMFISLMTFSCIFPFRGWALYCISAFKGAVGTGFDYGSWMVVATIFYVIACVLYLVLMVLMRCDVKKMQDVDLSEYEEKYKNGLSLYQKTCLGLTLAWVFGCMLVSFFGGQEGFGLILNTLGAAGVTLLVVVAFLTVKVDGQPIITAAEVNKHFMWDMIFVVSTGMFIASLITAQETGVSAFVSQVLGPILAGKSEFMFLFLMAAIGLVLTNFLNNIAIMFIFMAVIGSMFAQGMIENVYTAGIMVALATIIGFYTPAASAYGAMAHGNEWCPSGKIYSYGLAVFIYLFIVMAIMIPIANMIF